MVLQPLLLREEGREGWRGGGGGEEERLGDGICVDECIGTQRERERERAKEERTN